MRRLLPFLLPILSLSAITARAQAPAVPNKNVVIVSSYNEAEVLSRSIISGLVRYGAAYERINVYSEYMNVWMISDEEALSDFADKLFSEYRNNKPDVVVMMGTTAFALLRDRVREEWGDVSVLLCAEEDYIGPREAYLSKRYVPEEERIPLVRFADPYNMVLAQAPAFLEKSVELMQRMLPGMEELLFITDPRFTNRQNDRVLSDIIAERFPSLRYRSVSSGDTTIERLIDTLCRIDRERTGVLFSSWIYEHRVADNKLLSAGAYRILSGFPTPLFTLRYAGMEDSNLVGGYIYDEKTYDDSVMELFQELIGGREARQLAPVYPEGRPIFNYHALVMRSLDPALCPPGTVLLGRPATFLERYGWWLAAALVVLSVLFLFQQSRIAALKKMRAAREREMSSRAQYANLFNSMPVIYMQEEVLFDEKGRPTDTIYCDVNARFEREFYPRDQIVGRRGSEMFPESLPEFLHFIALAVHEKKTVSFPYYNKQNGSYYDILISRSYLPSRVDVFGVDSSELHSAQQKLSDTNHKLSMALDVANIVPWKWDLRGHTILCDVNRAIALSGGVDMPHLAVPDAQYFAKICHEDRDRVRRAYEDLIEGRTEKVREEYRVLSTEGGKRQVDWVEAQAAVESRDEYGQPIVLIGSSLVITERKRMESELTMAKDRAEESNRLKSAFLANMSHEIRTPLNAIVGFSGILASTDEPEEKQEYLNIIEDNNALLLQLISDILDLSKIEAGTLEFIDSDFELTSFMHEKESMMRHRIQSERVLLQYTGPETECMIRCEKNRLSQVIINLISNAIKFTQDGSIRFGYELRGQMLYFYVSDTGCGIAPEDRKAVFERFVKLNGFKQGTGLGLPICQTIVNHMGGEIGVDSEVGKGSTFWFTLPYRQGSARPVVPDEFEPKTVEKNKLTILIAEDNDSNYKLFETILRHEYRLVHAWNGREAVELFQEHQPHIVLMDINMPVMNGYEATAEIRKISPDVPIIAVTAFAYSSDEQQVMQSGFNGYMAKPIQAGKLKAQILEVLRTRLTLI